MNLLSVLKKHQFPLAVLTVLVVVLAATNFTAGSWLSGWDNLHPEFNFWLNIGRTLSSVWQEYQGLGLLGGMSHAADLPRQLILLVLSVAVSPQYLRYVWVWLMWWFGAVGAYTIAQFIFTSKTEIADPKNTFAAKAAGLVAGLFYLLNLATVQYFYVPYESFSSFYGSLPWLLWAVFRYYQKQNRTRLSVLFATAVLSASAFYVQTLFVVFGLLVAVISLVQLATRRISWREIIITGAVLLAANAFWLLPSVYFTATSSQVTVESKVNRLSTVESQLMNQSFGTPLNIALLKGYWFGYQDFQNGNYTYLIPQWRAHLDQEIVVIIGIGIWLAAFIGIVISVRHDKKWELTWAICFVVVTIMLTSGNGPLGFIFSWASKHIPLFGQIFRTAFTKWSTAAALLYAIGLASLTYAVIHQIKNTQKIIAGLWIIGAGISFAVVVAPIFQGNLISPFMRLKQPTAYQELFTFFATQPKQTRIVNLPLPDFWAWSFYNWNYRGSGFLWYGIEQPIVDRNFDVWSAQNETFYNQLSTALFGQDPQTFLTLLKKYDISYALLDESLIVPNKDAIPNQVKITRELLKNIGAQPVWSKDSLTVYKIPGVSTQFVTAPSHYTPVWESATYSRIDPAYTEVGANIQTTSLPPKIVYPFAALGREELKEFTISKDTLHIEQSMPEISQQMKIVIPPIATGSAYPVQVRIQKVNDRLRVKFDPTGTVKIGDKTLPLPQLPELDLPMKKPVQNESFGSLTLNGQPVMIATGSADASSWVTLKAQSSIPIVGTLQTGNEIERVETTLPAEFWRNLSVPEEADLSPGKYSAKLDLLTQWTDVPLTGLNSQNCEVFKRGTVSDDNEGLSVIYQANEYGSLCTGTLIPLLNTKMSGIVRFTGENQSGRSIKFYVTNQNAARPDLEELLDSGTFENIYTLLEWPFTPAQLYGMNWETRSFGQPSINKLNAVQVMPVQMRRLASIRLEAKDPTPTKNAVVLSNNWKVGTYQYGTVAKSDHKDGLVTLSQSFDRGWVGIAVPLSGAVTPQLLPHVLYNGWANGWLLPQGEYQVILLYWPQLLGFLGIFILVASAIWLFFSRQKQ